MRSLATFAAFAMLALVPASCRTTADADVARRLDALFRDLHERGLFDGAVVVANGGRIVWKNGFGFANAERQVRFTPDTPADGASLAKTFTAALVLMLHAEGRLGLDEPARRFLPELPYPDITLRHLLSHSSGIPVLDYDYFDKLIPPDRIRTTEGLLAVLAERNPPLAFEPGTAFEYSSFGYDLAALAASRAAGKSYAELLNERFFRPLGIESAFVRPGRLSAFPGIRTLGYRRDAGTLVLNEVFDFEAFHGGSNIYISARDLHRWNASLFDKLPSGALQFARIGNHPSGLTLDSWYRTDDDGVVWYSGHLQGFHSEVFRDMWSRRSIIYVSNNTIEPWMQKGVIRAVSAILDGHDPRPLVPPATEDVRKEERESLAGAWSLSDGTTFRIESSNGRIDVRQNGVRYRMVQISPRAFYVPGLDWMIGFARDGNSFDRIHVESNVREQWGQRQ